MAFEKSDLQEAAPKLEAGTWRLAIGPAPTRSTSGVILTTGEVLTETSVSAGASGAGHPRLSIGFRASVNLSPDSLSQAGSGGLLVAHLSRAGLDVTDVQFDLTEGAIINPWGFAPWRRESNRKSS